MKHQEQKYLIDDFAPVERKLKIADAQKTKESSSTHYYAQQLGNDVVKLVAHDNHYEIHKLKEEGTKFVLTNKVQLERIEELKEFEAVGDIGYAVLAKNDETTDYYYVDIKLRDSEEDNKDKPYKSTGHYVALNEKLSEYLKSEPKYQLHKCSYEMYDDNDEDGLVLGLRAYFVKIA